MAIELDSIQHEWVCQKCRTKTTERPSEHQCKLSDELFRKYLAIRRVDFDHYAAEVLEIQMATEVQAKNGVLGRLKAVKNLYSDGSAGEPYDIAVEAIMSASVQELEYVQRVEKCKHGLWIEAICPDCVKCKHDVQLSKLCVPCRRLAMSAIARKQAGLAVEDAI